MNREEIEELLAEFVERRDRGETLDAESFVADHPEHADDLREVLRDLEGTDAMLPSGDDLVPDRIGAWRVIGPLSRGGMGRVLRVVRNGEDGPERALKVLGDAGLAHPRARTRLQREGEALMRLRHPGVVRCHEIGFVGDLPFLVMDLVPGSSLAEIVHAAKGNELRLPGDGDRFRRIATIVAKLARSVAALHGAGLLHRDLKPANVVVHETTGDPVLLDFGLVGGEELATLTRSGDVLGTPAYMPPEQARGDRLDARADVFGLGAILFELLTLEPPRRGQGSRSVLEEVRSQTVRSVRDVDASVPPSLAGIVSKAMSWHRRWRYGSVLELAEDLEAFAGQGVPSAGGKPLAQRVAEMWQFRRPWIAGAAALVVLAAVVVATRRGPTPEEIAVRVAEVVDRFVEYEFAAIPNSVAALRELAPDHTVARVFGADPEKAAPESWSEHARALHGGRAALRAKKPKEAEVRLRRALELSSAEPVAIVLLGWIAFTADRPEEARVHLESAARLLPQCRSAHWLLASLRIQSGDLDGAERALQRGFDLGEPNVSLLVTRAKLRRKRRELGTALADVERSLAMNADRPRRAQLNLKGVLLEQLQRREEANDVFRELARRYPGFSGALFNLGYSLDEDCRLDEARIQYEHALKVRPDYPSALINLAWLHAGSDREKCEKCRAEFTAKPSLFDLDLAEDYVVRAVRAIAGRDLKKLSTAIGIAKRIERRAKVRDVLRKMSADPKITTEQLGALTRALRWLK